MSANLCCLQDCSCLTDSTVAHPCIRWPDILGRAVFMPGYFPYRIYEFSNISLFLSSFHIYVPSEEISDNSSKETHLYILVSFKYNKFVLYQGCSLFIAPRVKVLNPKISGCSAPHASI
jgi:hypothetical protein